MKFLFKIFAVLTAILCSGCAAEPQAHSFGAIADCQYCDVKSKGLRKYNISDKKLTECVHQLNKMDLAFTVHLGDFIDRDFKSFDKVGPIYNQLKMDKYHVLGNHDFSVKDELKKDVPAKLNMPSKYYDFEVKGWRYVVLDGNDVSLYAYPKDSKETAAAAEYYKKNKIKSPKWNGAVGEKQIAWLKDLLVKAEKEKENVVLFCHFPVYPANNHNLWNAEQVVALLEKYSCVKAYINGHNHKGNYAVKDGIHFLTLKGMVDSEKTSYAVIKVDDKFIRVEGFGREKDRELPIKK